MISYQRILHVIKMIIKMSNSFISERDAKAFYESAEARKIEFEKLITQLRAENKAKRIVLRSSIEVKKTQAHIQSTCYIIQNFCIFT